MWTSVCVMQTDSSVSDRLHLLALVGALLGQKTCCGFFLRVLGKPSRLLVMSFLLALDADVGLTKLPFLSFCLILDCIRLVCVFLTNGFHARSCPRFLWLLVLREVLLIVEKVLGSLILPLFCNYQIEALSQITELEVSSYLVYPGVISQH